MKIGRNAKCPCNSGKKYKRCHLKIEKLRKQLELNNLRDISDNERKQLQSHDRENIKQFLNSKGKKCLYSNCDRKPINSHTFPKNILEKQIARKNNNEYLVFSTDLRHIVGNLQDSKLHSEFFYEVNINNAGTMPLFCNEHDSRIFSPIETFTPLPNVKQYIFLYAYRFFLYHFLKEKYVLVDNQGTIIPSKGVGKSLSPDTRDKRNFIYANATTIAKTKTNILNLDILKNKFEEVMKSTLPSDIKIDENFTVYSYPFKNNIYWCGAGSTELSYDNSPITSHLGCSFGLIPQNGSFPAYFYCVVPNEEIDYLKDRLLKLLDESYESYKRGIDTNTFENIVKYYIFDSSENIIISPNIIDKLKDETCYIKTGDKVRRISKYQLLLEANILLTQAKGIKDEKMRDLAYKFLSMIDLF